MITGTISNFWKSLTSSQAAVIPMLNRGQSSDYTSSVLYDQIRPIFLLAQWLGLFPVSNLQSWTAMRPASLTSFLRLPLIIALGYQLVDVAYIAQKALREEQDIEDEEMQAQRAFYYKAPYICAVLTERLNGICVFLYVLLATKKFLQHFAAWQVLNSLLENFKKSLKRFALTVTTMAFLLALAQAVLMAKLGEKESNLWQKIFAITCFLANYAVLHLQACFLVFSFALFQGFKVITMEMEDLLLHRSARNFADQQILSENLSKLRLNHQQLCVLAKETSELLHPVLLIIITSILLSHSVTFYGTYSYLVWFKGSSYGTVVFLIFVYMVLIKMFPLGAMCYLGENVKKQSTAGKTYLYQVCEKNINEAFKLQLRLLESKFNNQPVKLNASGFLNMDYRLFMQIAGAMYTYCLVVIQYIDSRKAMSTAPPLTDWHWQNISALLQVHKAVYNENFNASG